MCVCDLFCNPSNPVSLCLSVSLSHSRIPVHPSGGVYIYIKVWRWDKSGQLFDNFRQVCCEGRTRAKQFVRSKVDVRLFSFHGVPGLFSDVWLGGIDEFGCLQPVGLVGATELFCKRGSLGTVLCSCFLVQDWKASLYRAEKLPCTGQNCGEHFLRVVGLYHARPCSPQGRTAENIFRGLWTSITCFLVAYRAELQRTFSGGCGPVSRGQ